MVREIKKDHTKTMLTISMGFLVLYMIFGWKWAVWVSISSGIIGLASSYLSKKIEFLWIQLAKLLGLIVPNILLSILFYLFLFPIAILSRLFGKASQIKLKDSSNSTFVEMRKDFDENHFKNPW